MHKYERGVNRVSASRLYEIAEALRVPVTYFYEGIDEPPHGRTLNPRERLTLEVVRSVAAIADPRLQEVLGNLARSLAAPPPTGEADDAAEETPDRKRGAAL
jgi:transcriptional regulator with XRE-family HTH domain